MIRNAPGLLKGCNLCDNRQAIEDIGKVLFIKVTELIFLFPKNMAKSTQ